MKTTYLNIKTSLWGTETIDELSQSDFNSYKEFRAELFRLKSEYHLAGIPVYSSSRCTKEWKSK